jgi:hypothetical protein
MHDFQLRGAWQGLPREQQEAPVQNAVSGPKMRALYLTENTFAQ